MIRYLLKQAEKGHPFYTASMSSGSRDFLNTFVIHANGRNDSGSGGQRLPTLRIAWISHTLQKTLLYCEKKKPTKPEVEEAELQRCNVT